MSLYAVRSVGQSTLDLDEARFDTGWGEKLTAREDIELTADLARAYCRWFVGNPFGWRSSWGHRWGQSKRPLLPDQVADHIAGVTSAGGYPYHLHTLCKWSKELPKYWTRYLLIDLDAQGDEFPSLVDRFDICREALGKPVTLRSVNKGLHLLWSLQAPMSVLGLTCKGPRDLPVLLDDLLAHYGLEARPGQLEFYPQPRRTIRLPLASGEYLLDDELLPMEFSSRAKEITYLVEQMDEAARDRPVDVNGLIGRLAHHKAKREPRRSTSPVQRVSPGSSAPELSDVHFLEVRGLQEQGTRNRAAMALARHKMLREGWTAGRTVSFLMRWTAEKGNGKSRGQGEVKTPGGQRQLRKEYERICDGIRRFAQRTKKAGLGSPRTQLLSTTDTSRILTSTHTLPAGRQRYWREVFLFHLLGYFRDQVKDGGSTPSLIVSAQVSSVVLQRSPNGSNDRYRAHLRWATEHSFVHLRRNYLHSPTVGRARTYEATVNIDPPPSPHNASMLRRAAEAVSKGSRRVVTIRQCEHAVVAWQHWGRQLSKQYGRSAAERIRRIVKAVVEASALQTGEAA